MSTVAKLIYPYGHDFQPPQNGLNGWSQKSTVIRGQDRSSRDSIDRALSTKTAHIELNKEKPSVLKKLVGKI